jgi:hypothetical protein
VQQQWQWRVRLRTPRIRNEGNVGTAAHQSREQLAEAGAACAADPGVYGRAAGDCGGPALAGHRVISYGFADRGDVLIELSPADGAAGDLIEGALPDLAGQPEADRGQCG